MAEAGPRQVPALLLAATALLAGLASSAPRAAALAPPAPAPPAAGAPANEAAQRPVAEVTTPAGPEASPPVASDEATPVSTPGAPHPATAPAAGGWRHWLQMPLYGADVRALAVSPGDPDVVLAGTSAGQIYFSRDGGSSWSDAGVPLPFPGWLVSSLHFDPNRPGRLWASLQGIWGGGSVASSDDLGKSWSARARGLPEEPIYTLALAPGREGRLFAATLSGVFGSEDDGASWRRLTGDLPEMQKVTSLLVDPSRPDSVIAGTWRRAYRSDDGGKTWSGIFDGMVLDTEVFSLTPLSERPGEIWASTCGWVYQTVDHGDHWQRFKEGLDERRTTSFAALPGGRMVAGTVSGVYVSDDEGRSWRRQSDPALSALSLAVHPARPERILVGTEGAGVWISRDGGASFFRSSRGMSNLRVAALAASGRELWVAVNFAGPASGVYLSRDGGTSFGADFWPLPTITDLAASAGRIFAATVRGLYERRGGDWFHLPDLGSERVDQLVVDGDQVLARTGRGLFELHAGRFFERPYKHGPPRSAAWFGGALWVSDGAGLYSLTRDANHTVPAPQPGARLLVAGGRLLIAGSGGAWMRDDEAGTWSELTGEPSRLFATGDPRYGALLVSGETARLYDRESHRFHVIEVPFPARDIASALVLDGRLLLGTSGYGVLAHEVATFP